MPPRPMSARISYRSGASSGQAATSRRRPTTSSESPHHQDTSRPRGRGPPAGIPRPCGDRAQVIERALAEQRRAACRWVCDLADRQAEFLAYAGVSWCPVWRKVVALEHAEHQFAAFPCEGGARRFDGPPEPGTGRSLPGRSDRRRRDPRRRARRVPARPPGSRATALWRRRRAWPRPRRLSSGRSDPGTRAGTCGTSPSPAHTVPVVLLEGGVKTPARRPPRRPAQMPSCRRR